MKIRYMQSFFAAAGSESCYSLCLIDVAREYLEKYGLKLAGNELDALEMGINHGYIDFNPVDYSDLGRAFTVVNPCGFLKDLTGTNWKLKKTERDYVASDNEYVIEFSALSEENGKNGKGHFWRQRYNSIQDSKICRDGFIYSKRVMEPIGIR